MSLSLLRRVLVAAIGIGVSAVLLRPQISSALVVRGDELNYRGETAPARRLWQRAIAWDSNDREAVDRLCFSEIMSHSPGLLEHSVATATAYLDGHRGDALILADRALALEILGKFAQAEVDFSLAGRATQDVRTLTFAGFAAIHAGHRAFARQLFSEATRVDPHFLPASRGLARVL